ncbi:YihY/virulence factor BrkB family protein [Myxococcaceae bacterium GXIMD 01537]
MVLPGKGMGWGEFFKLLKDEYTRDKVSDVAGSLTFFGVLALFPFLLFLVALAGLIIDPKQAQALIDELARVAPQEVTAILGQRLRELGESSSVGLLTLGGVGAIWAASSGIAALMRALNAAYGVEESRPYWKVRAIALVSTLLSAGVSILAALAAVATPALGRALGEPFEGIITWLRLPVAGVLMMFVWALLYWALPDVHQKFKLITPGSVVGVIIWLIASWGFSKYVANFGKYSVNYGAIGGVIVLLLWMWITSQVVLLGAEVNSLLEQHSAEGKAPGAREPGQPGVVAEAEQRGPEAPAAPLPLKQTPLAAAAKWAAGLGLGLFLLRRGESR